MNNALVYIHGKGGNAAEASHYVPLFPSHDVIGFDYKSEYPWDAKEEFSEYFRNVCQKYSSITIIANSIGAYFLMNAEVGDKVKEAYFISPVVDMEKLISDMLIWSGADEERLRTEKAIETDFGETLSWEYLCYARENAIKWNVPTHILYGENDNLTSFETISAFSKKIGASLCVMPKGEHWFHTERQTEFLYGWIRKIKEEDAKIYEHIRTHIRTY